MKELEKMGSFKPVVLVPLAQTLPQEERNDYKMKNMKFLTALLLAGMLALSLTACGNNGMDDNNNGTTTTPVSNATTTSNSATAETTPSSEENTKNSEQSSGGQDEGGTKKDSEKDKKQ